MKEEGVARLVFLSNQIGRLTAGVKSMLDMVYILELVYFYRMVRDVVFRIFVGIKLYGESCLHARWVTRSNPDGSLTICGYKWSQ